MEKKWWTLLAICAGTFMLLLDVTIVIVALPNIQTGLGATFADVQWVVDAYALTLASLLLTAGVLADRYGRRLLFIIGLVTFTGGSLLCGLAQSPLMLILSRSFQGIGGAIMFSTSLALIGQSFQGKERGLAFGVWGAITGVAVSLGPIFGGLITTGISWRGIFLVNVPIGIAALVVTVLKVDESKAPRPGRLDWAGFVFLTTGLVGVAYGLIRAGETDWSNGTVVASLIAGVVLLFGFVIAEAKVADPMFDLALFRTPTFVGGLTSAFAMNGSLFAMLLYLVIYLQDLLGYSALGAGLRILVTSLAMLVAATVSGRLSERVPVRWLIGPGLLLVGVGLLLMSGITGTSSWGHLVPGFIVAGIGSGMVNPPLASTAIGVVRPERAGMASGVNATLRQVGIAVSIAALGSIFTSAVRNGLTASIGGVPALSSHSAEIISSVPAAIRSSFASGINDLLDVTAGLALAGGVLAVFLIRSKDFVKYGPPGDAAAGASEPEEDVVADVRPALR
jgi:EmrB/QacA subfamily drug resistance transporter